MSHRYIVIEERTDNSWMGTCLCLGFLGLLFL